ncbi:tetratricopeptide repeat protein [Lentzea sp. PSKA42]|uniref:Tetratricopeptide repeat protein n=1 Tax=Lentzea indica TaxID=2604800 RepID=A0ABX1FG27_9PSEU|nr:BTAD domain-containing putative transcriptional regulator [Lentzea indica]NKE57827.1 tetratricopeptide repeat protein [Lentzea indica]
MTGDFGRTLRARRQAAGLTQRELAQRAGMSVRAVRNLENGRTAAPRGATSRQLDAALETACGPELWIGVLGPLQLRVGGRSVEVRGTKTATLLGLLALQPNSAVPREEIVDVLWDGRPPASQAQLVGVHTGRLRRLVGPLLQAVRGGGYRLAVDAAQLDLLRFNDIADRFGYAEALDCWRGPVLGGRLRQHPAAVALADRRVALALSYADIGPPADVIAMLRPLLADEPMHEGLHARMVLALAASGQQVSALQHFERVRSMLVRELGVEPGEELRAAQLKVLRGQTVVGERNCLPRDLPDFTGRDDELRALLDDPCPVTVIDGMAGIGKTALAVHLAHALAGRYPGGTLFLDLGAGHDPLSACDALESLLRQLGVEGERIPVRTDDCAALWRALTADRRVLVVLDNVSGAAQVRPLLPSGGRAILTSRTRLSSLEGVRQLSLDVLPDPDAATLFARMLGRPVAAAEVLRLCGFLPLAVRIAAAKLRAHPSWTVAYLADRLRDEHLRLGELRVGDRAVDAAFSLSYQQLTEPQRRLFRLLGDCPALEFDVDAAGALVENAEQLLHDLLDAHLLLEPTPGRFRFHDLLRQHARSMAVCDEPDRASAQLRLIDHYLHRAAGAADALEPTRRRWDTGGTSPFAGPAEAMAWLVVEHENLVAVVAAASSRGLWTPCWQLAQCLWRFFFLRGHLRDWVLTHRLALAAARRCGDLRAEAETRKNLGLAHWRRASFAEALDHHYQALLLDEREADVWGRAKTHNHLGFIHARMGHHDQAVHHQQSAVALYQDAGDDCGQARAQIGLGDAHFQAGSIDASRVWFARALDLTRLAGDRWGEGLALIGLGFARREHGRPLLERALVLTRALGDRWSECLALTGLGIHDHLAGATDRAVSQLRGAVSLARSTGDRWGLRLALSAVGRVLSDRSEAVAAHEEALELTRSLRNRHLEAEVLADLAAVAGMCSA